MMVGTLSTIDVPQAGRLAVYSAQVARNNRDQAQDVADRSAGNPIPAPGGASPIEHVIYVIKENCTFDQVFGDETIGDTDNQITLFGRSITPNQHALAERFGLLDNFYADAEVSADGHNWATSANASDYAEKMWPQDYAPGAGRNRGYDFEGASKISLSAGGYLWDAAPEWSREFPDFVANGDLAQLEIMRIPNDHTAGTRPGAPPSFITEDDAQNGPDHVDAHRTTSLLISPYTSMATPRVEHGLYDTAAMLLTVELILGLRPLSQFDADAMPMWQMFQAKPDATPYSGSPRQCRLRRSTQPNPLAPKSRRAWISSRKTKHPRPA